ncbi:MAG: nicotinate-nucleotide diphosphorylase (carboxylating) [Candidatus Fischerbacteria bacterium RBG_13_37_8]|uniref:Probable nicotinate-nucleotide pyrophosphorylase [carboxylating] n=1 Tax=Candidatus Fischerbacteria bacterium RBG_13_37_8 TaxID=1817863 RepID=A0A1F5VVK6_9BACT|nr:MAG: nicotinate-nucleotide diphosphorylase (carboxylating) [Candidatus Fischerbacteria bacterium RBG_13_37_8]
MFFHIDTLIKMALEEDIRSGDITSHIIIDKKQKAEGTISCKEEIILAGIFIVRRIFEIIDDSLLWQSFYEDGQHIPPGTVIAKIKGSARSLLSGERTALNFLQHLSGIATETKRLAALVQNYSVRITDTRKTLPGMRYLQKYAVKTGGGLNHRIAMDDGILIKNNHLKFCSSISEALKKAHAQKSYLTEIEIEVSTIDELQEALSLKPSIIMLDNFSYEELEKAIKLAKGKCKIEVSGGITRDNLEKIAALQPDYISLGSLTHSVRAVDIHMIINPIDE